VSQLVELDGASGEGGGQILRTALSLSIITRRPFRIRNIRAGRRKPGLMRQHLVCVKAAQEISAADVSGAELGSQSLEFVPQDLVGGAHHFAIGSAGSVALVAQTLIPALLKAPDASRVCIEGGTHTMLAPTTCYLSRVFLPMLHKMGGAVTLEVEREGLFPIGGGRVVLKLEPGSLQALDLSTRGAQRRIAAEALLVAVPEHVGVRECEVIRTRFPSADCQPRKLSHALGSGNVLSLWAEFEHVSELVTCFGERGIRAETVAERACEDLERYLASDVVVGEYLTDQLLLPMALAGAGSMVCAPLSQHARTNIETIERFGIARFDLASQCANRCVVRVRT
jgi:RNA 3'-terminal phosphate cyclase (ATP)